MSVVISLLIHILFKIISIVSSNGAFVNIKSNIKSRVKVIKLRHNKKIYNLCKQHGIDKLSETKPPKNTQFFRHMTLQKRKFKLYHTDQHIPSNPDRHKINTNFEYFYQNVLNDISDLLQHHLDNIKTKLRLTCLKYHNSKTAKNIKQLLTSYQKTTLLLFIIKQDKGRGVVILDHTKYIDKCLLMVATKQFSKLGYDSTSKLESKVQRTLRKIKSKLPENVYKKLYLT